MSALSLLGFMATLAAVAVMPGPSIAALVARVLSRGAREVLPFLAAMWLGDVIWLSFAIWGLAALAHMFQTAFEVIRWIGVGYLLILAWNMWHAPTTAAAGRLPAPAAPLRMFGAGLAVTLGNPKIMMFYLALLPSIIDLSRITVTGWAEMSLAVIVTLAVIDLGWVALALRARAMLRSPRAMRAANRLGAGVMAGAATTIALR